LSTRSVAELANAVFFEHSRKKWQWLIVVRRVRKIDRSRRSDSYDFRYVERRKSRISRKDAWSKIVVYSYTDS